MLISLSIRVELYLINVLYNYASIFNMLPYVANTVSAWQLCQCFDFMIVFTPYGVILLPNVESAFL